MIELNKIYNVDCLVGIKYIPDESVDCILTDPPYLYLKNQKLDRPFDEQAFFAECKRVLKKNGFIVLFGRGTSFYRWNCILADMGFTFKEEIIWDKSYCSSPLMALSRVHETVSIHTLGNGNIKKVKVPYIEMKRHDLGSIIPDVKRLITALRNTKSLDAILNYLEDNKKYLEAKRIDAVSIQSETSQIKRIDYKEIERPHNVTTGYNVPRGNKCCDVMQSITAGMNEKSIIRTDYKDIERPHNVTTGYNVPEGNRCCNVMQSITAGMNEKSIIKQPRDHYKTIHPTQKPVRLLERLLNLVCTEGCIVLDPFSGSGSTAIACINTNRNYIGFEIDKEYYDLSLKRINNI